MSNNTYYFNGSPIVAPLSIKSNEPFYDNITRSLKNFRTSQGAQRWELSFMIRNPTSARQDLISRVVGFDLTKTMVMPQLNDVVQNSQFNGAHILTTGSAAVFATSVGVSLPPDNKLSEGYFISFANHGKIYLVLNEIQNLQQSSVSITGAPLVGNTLSASVLTPAAINTTLTIYPELKAPVPPGTRIFTGSDVLLNYKMSDTTYRGIIYEDGILTDAGAIELFEAL